MSQSVHALVGVVVGATIVLVGLSLTLVSPDRRVAAGSRL